MLTFLLPPGGDLDLNMEESLKDRWQVAVGDEYEIVVCDYNATTNNDDQLTWFL